MLNFFKVKAALLAFLLLISLLFFYGCSDGLGVGLGTVIDTSAPTVAITYPPEASIIKGAFVVAGECDDDKGVSVVSVTITGQNYQKSYGPVSASLADDKKSWRITIDPSSLGLTDDTYTVSVIAKDDAGHSYGPISETVDIDNTAPVFVVSSPSIIAEGNETKKYSKFGSSFSVEGVISETHRVSFMTAYIYDENGDLVSSVPYNETNIDTSGSTTVTFARWRDSKSETNPTRLNTRYEEMFGSYTSDDPAPATKYYSCGLVFSDNARTYNDPALKTGTGDGNKTTSFYLNGDIFNDLLSGVTGAGLTASDLRNVLNGTASDFSDTYTVDYVRNYLAANTTKSLNIDDNGDVYKGKTLGFSLNPATNPKYSVSGFSVSDVFNSEAYKSGAYDQVINISLSAGLDGTNILLDTVKVWLIKTLDEVPSGITDTLSEFAVKADKDELSEFTAFTYQLIDTSESISGGVASNDTFSVSIPAGIINAYYYYIVVTGRDMNGYPFGQSTVYGFTGTSAGTAPTVEITSPAANSYIKSAQDISISGTAYVDDETSFVEKASVTVTISGGGYSDKFTGNAVVTDDPSSSKSGKIFTINESSLKNTDGLKPSQAMPSTEGEYTYIVKVKATTAANVSTPAEVRANIDTKQPVVTITSISGYVDGNEYEGGDPSKTYVNGDVNISGKVVETNLKDVTWELYVDGKKRNYKTGVIDNDAVNSVGAEFSFTLPDIDTTLYVENVDDQIPMKVVITAIDEAGNKTALSSDVFTILQDTDVPVVSLSDTSINTALTDKSMIKVGTNLFGIKDKIDIDMSDDDAVASVKVEFEPVDDTLEGVTRSKKFNTTSTSYSCAVPSDEGVYSVLITVTDTKFNSNNLTEFVQACRSKKLGPFYIAVSEGAPDVSITSPSAGSYYGKQFTVSGTVESEAEYVTAVVTDRSDNTKKYSQKIDVIYDGNTNTYSWSDVMDLSQAGDGLYYIAVTSTDKYEQTASSGKINFTVDTTNPVISSPAFSVNKINAESTRYPSLSATVTDNVSLAAVKYYISNSQTAPSGDEQTETWTEMNQGSNNVWSSKIDFSSDIEDTYYAWIMAKDTAGNKVITSSPVSADVDTILPESDIILTLTDAQNSKLYDSTFIQCDAAVFGGTYYSDGGFTLSGTVTESDDSYTTVLTVNGTPVTITEDKTNRKWSYVQEDSEGLYTYKLKVTDKASNSFEKSLSVNIDTSAPEVEITSPASGESFEGSSYVLKLKGSSYDEVAGIKSVKYTISKDGTVLVDNAAATLASAGWSANYTLNEEVGEGSFVIVAVAEDNLGRTKTTESRSFYYDKSVPELDETGVGTSRLTTNSKFALEGTASDTNGLSKVTVAYDKNSPAVEASVDDSGNWSISFNDSEDNSSVNLSDGDWSFTVTATDIANKTTVLTRYVTIDTAVPEVKEVSFNAADKTINDIGWYKKSQVTLSVKGSDSLSGIDSVEYALSYDSQTDTYGEWSSLGKKENTGSDKSTYKYYWTGNVELLSEGSNTIYIRAKDVAGNYSDVKDTDVYKDTVAPSFDELVKVGDVTEGLSESYELIVNGTKDLVTLFSLNESGSGIASVSLKKIGTVSYADAVAVTSPDADGLWNLTLTKEQISKGTTGAVTVSVSDNAGNSAEYQLFQLQIDRTPPKVTTSVSPVVNTSYLNGKVTVSGNVTESNPDTLSYQLYVGGVAEGDSTEVSLTDNKYSFEINTASYTDKATLKIVLTASDKAGNTGTNEVSYTISQDTDRPVILLTNADLSSDMSETKYCFHTNHSLTGTVTDDDGNVTSVEYSYNGTDYLTDGITLTGGSFTLNFPTDSDDVVKDGNYTVWFRVTDSEGTVFTSKAVSDNESVKISSNSNSFGEEGKSGLLYLTVDTVSPEADINAVSLDGGATWQTGFSGITLGGETKSVKVRVDAKDTSGISSVTLKTAVAETIYQKDIATVKDDDGYYTGTISCENGTGSLTITATVKDNASRTTNTSKSIAIDNTAPVITFNGPSSSTTSSGGITVYGSVDSTSTMYYAVSTSDTVSPSSSEEVKQWTDADGNTHTFDDISTSSSYGYKSIKDSSLAWYVYFDGDTDKSQQTETHSVNLNDYLIAYGITTKNALEDKSNPFEKITKLYVWIKAVDTVGNVTEKCHLIMLDPQGDRPTAAVSYPSEDGGTVGGTVKLYGSAEDTKGSTVDKAGVKNVWLQIISTTHTLSSYNDKTGFGTFTTSSDRITSFTMTSLDLDYLADSGYSVYNMRTYLTEASHTPWTPGSSIPDGYTASDYGILTTVNGSSWNCNVNTKKELNPASGTNAVAFRIYAVDGDGKFSSATDRFVKFDASNPVLGEKQALYLIQSADSAITLNGSDYTFGATASKEYADDMYVKGAWYLIGSVTDDDKVALLTVGSDTLVGRNDAGEITVKTSNDGSFTSVIADGGKTVYFKYRLNTASGVGVDNPVIYAEDSASGKTEKDLSINYDNVAPVLTGAESTGYSLSPKISQSDGYYSMGSQVSEETVGTSSQSGVDYIAFWFMRRTVKNGTESVNVLNPLFGRSSAANTRAVSELTYDSGIYWEEKTVTRDKSSLNVLGYTSSGKDFIRKGGLVKLGGAIYFISDVSSNYITINGNPMYSSDEETAYFANAVIVNNTIQETGSNGKNADGYPLSVTNDDGDGVVEYIKKSGTTWTWSCDIVSKNMGDGPVELHYVAFDAAGNYSIGIMGNMSEGDYSSSSVFTKTDDRTDYVNLKSDSNRTSNVLYVDGVNTFANGSSLAIKNADYKYPAFIANNAPRISGFTIATDDNGNGVIDNDERITTWTGAYADKLKSSVSVEKSDGSAIITAKGLTSVTPEIIGGNGSLMYNYTVTKNGENTSYYEVNSLKALGTGADDYGLGTQKADISDDAILFTVKDLLSAGDKGKEIEDGDGQRFAFTIWDSTEGTSCGTDSQSALLNIRVNVALRDEKKPEASVLPFYWNSASSNSLYKNSTSYGHIELESDITDDIVSAGLSGDTPKVSGKIKIEGLAHDNTLLTRLYAQIKDGGKFELASYDTDSAKWTSNSTLTDGNIPSSLWACDISQATYGEAVKAGYISQIPSGFTESNYVPYVSQDWGHIVKWTIYVDTSLIAGASVSAAKDRFIRVSCEDQGKPVLDSSAATGFSYTKNASPEGSVQTGSTLTDYYGMDVVPYIVKISTSLSSLKKNNWSVYNRTSTGSYPVYVVADGNTIKSGEVIKVYGFNLTGAKYKNKNGSSASTAPVQDYETYTGVSLDVADITGSGALELYCNEVQTLNNCNKNNAMGSYGEDAAHKITDDNYSYCYNRQPNKDNNNLLTDDVKLAVWQIDSTAVSPIRGRVDQPVMHISPATGMVGFAFANGPLYFSMPNANSTIVNDDCSYDYWCAGYDFFTSIGFVYDKLGKSYGVAAGGDINSNSASNFKVYSSRWGAGTRDRGGEYNNTNSLRLEQIGQKDANNTNIFNKQRILSPSMATAVHGSNTNLYMAYYDDINGEVRFRAGTITNTKTNSGNYVDTYTSGVPGNYATGVANVVLLAGRTSGKNTGYDAGEYVSVAVVSGEKASTYDDVPVVIWYDAESHKLKYTYDDTSYCKATLDNNKGKYSYTNGSPAFNGFATPVDVFEDEYIGEHCKIAVDKDGGIHIASYDAANADVVYAYKAKYDDAGFTKYVVDSYGIVGSKITLDVGYDDTLKKNIPYIGYYAASCVRPKTAHPVKASFANGADDDIYTGDWEVSVIPTSSTVPEDHINVALRKTDGVIAATVTSNSTAKQSVKDFASYVNDVADESWSYGYWYANGTKNEVLAYQVKKGTSGYIETAQLK